MKIIRLIFSLLCTCSLSAVPPHEIPIQLPDAHTLKQCVEQWCTDRGHNPRIILPYFYEDALKYYAGTRVTALEIRFIVESAWTYFCTNKYYSPRGRELLAIMDDNDDIEQLISFLIGDPATCEATRNVSRTEHTAALKQFYKCTVNNRTHT